ncbi:NAD(P)-binding Rossmann-fold superfamily protein [Wolffia australiana]
MELLSLPSSPAASLPPCFLKRSSRSSEGSGILSGQPLSSGITLGRSNRRLNARRRSRPIGLIPLKYAELNTRATIQAQDKNGSKDGNVAFVAGATGKVGSRTVRELLKLGFRVRAGVRSVQRADPLLQSVKQLTRKGADLVDSEVPPIERFELVECDLENEGQIGSAIGNASIVICCIGASEKEILDVTGPYRIDYKATVNLIEAATASKVEQFFLVTSLGTNKIGFPAALLNLFWGVLCWKRKAEEALIASGLPYTIVRPGGMERPTDSFKETHNLVLADQDTYFGGLVSNLQVAELLAFMAKNRSLSYCKVIEVIAETTAPRTPMGDLLNKIPSQREYSPPAPREKEESLPTPTPSEKEIVENGAAPIPTSKQTPTPQSPFTAYDDLKPPSSPSPSSPVIQNPSSSSSGQAGVPEIQPLSPRPSSPFIMYDDLKPPSSPSPNAPVKAVTPQEVSAETTIKISAARPSSPYFMYDDLKPPSSPSPSAPFIATAVESVEALPDVVKPKSTSPSSPFVMYDDLKPPSSPSPNAPVTAVAVAPPSNAIASEQTLTEYAPLPSARPSSPFYMYEDLKPPTSPTPSLPK